MALGLPLTITLQRRATAELEAQALIQAQGIVAAIDPSDLDDPEALEPLVLEASQQVGGRVVIVDQDGTLVADSDGPEEIGTMFATEGRPEITAALQGTPNSDIRDSEDLSEDIMATAVPIRDEDEIVGAVRITKSVQHVNDNVRNLTLGLMAIGFAALIAGLVLAFGLASSLSRPLTRLAAAAKRIGDGDLSARAGEMHGATEIEDVSRSFDEMADRLERSVQAQREFVANASHQLRTPLTAMKLRLEGATADAPTDELRSQLEAAESEVDRLSAIVDRLLVMARDIEEGTAAHADLSEAVTRAAERWGERARAMDSTLSERAGGGIAHADPADLDQILDNLLDNAISYAPGEVTIESGVSNGQVFLAVQDRGPGIAADDLDRVTERFFRGRGVAAGGSGLGLAIAKQLAEKWGGSLEVRNRDEGGTRIEVVLRPTPDSARSA